ncbi:MAG: hypothetical protein QOG84_847 [Sphingomonadales bacterium]|jgi:hypothetical protein|nr:hypothetical protein [Sphingomonadales bacterium]
MAADRHEGCYGFTRRREGAKGLRRRSRFNKFAGTGHKGAARRFALDPSRLRAFA